MDDQGHEATSPWQMPMAAWIAIGKRTWAEATKDNVALIAAGVAFYGFLALVPLLGAVVLIYGLAANPASVMRNMTQLTAVMPADVAKLVGEQLMNVVKTSDGKKGLGLLLALGLALFGARNGAGSVITALNVAYEEEEKRGFLKVNLLAIAMTAVAALIAMIVLFAIAALGHLESLIPNAPGVLIIAGKILAYVVMTMAGAGAAASLYRYGPSREQARWVWLTPGSLCAAVMWLLLTIGFGIYVAKVGNYSATYGSLGAVVVTLTWLYLSSYILMFGAELNAELEHQTAEDTTRRSAPLGERGAWVADHVAGPEKNAGAPQDEARGATHRIGIKDLAAGRAAARAGQTVGLPRVGWKASMAATIGLSLLRKGRGREGLALLGATAAVIWLRRERSPSDHNKIGAILFDVDGTLVDSNDYHAAAWTEAFHEEGYDDVTPSAIHEQIGKGRDLFLSVVLPQASHEVAQMLSARHDEIFAEKYRHRVRPFDDAALLLRRACDTGLKVVLASSGGAEETDFYIRLLGVADMVIATTTSNDIDTSKLAGNAFLGALKKIGPTSPAQTIIVGDTPDDMKAAADRRMRALGVCSGGFDDAVLLQAGASAVYDDVAHVLADFEAAISTG